MATTLTTNGNHIHRYIKIPLMHILLVPINNQSTILSILCVILYSSFIKLCLYAVVSQFFITEAENEYVIKGNSAIMKCKIPSFVADFVIVDAWINVADGTELTHETTAQDGLQKFIKSLTVVFKLMY